MKYVIDINDEVLGEVVIEINNGVPVSDEFVFSISIKSKNKTFKDYFKVYSEYFENIPQIIVEGLDHIAKKSNIDTNNIKRRFLR